MGAPVNDDEYRRLFSVYEQERRTLQDIMSRSRASDQQSGALQSRIDYAQNNINALWAWLDEVNADLQEAHTRYNNLKSQTSTKVRYVVEDVEEEEYQTKKVKVRSSWGSEGGFGSQRSSMHETFEVEHSSPYGKKRSASKHSQFSDEFEDDCAIDSEDEIVDGRARLPGQTTIPKHRY